ncbi:MAG: hypothetical protein JW745_07225 [Sedimentisphaerales bacterium]|nr:hypothetical protein [Sedimentisphaerales bacterium]MBN2841678.1 hypothetical protein [Sedimentisphaerales bacterium]
MLRTIKAFLALSVAAFVSAGCQSNKPMPIEANFRQITVGQNTSDEILNIFSQEKVLQTTDKISLLNNKGKFHREAAIATIDPTSSLLNRYVYMSRTKDFNDVKLRIVVEARVPQNIMLNPYESNAQRDMAILRFCHESLRNDTKAFSQEQETTDLMNLASMVLGLGIAKLEAAPRDITDITTEKGFTYIHTTAGECKIRLEQHDNSDIFTMSVHTRGAFDWLVKW